MLALVILVNCSHVSYCIYTHSWFQTFSGVLCRCTRTTVFCSAYINTYNGHPEYCQPISKTKICIDNNVGTVLLKR